MLRYIKNVLTGINAHWNENHNKVIANLLKKTEKLGSVERTIAQEAILHSMQVTSSYFGPNRKNELTFNKISDKEIKNLEYSDFYKTLKGLIQLLLILLSTKNSVLSKYCNSTFNNLFGDELQAFNELKQSEKIVYDGLNNFTDASKILKNKDPILTYSFTTLIAELVESFECKRSA